MIDRDIAIKQGLFHHSVGVLIYSDYIFFNRGWLSDGIKIYIDGRISGNMKKFTLAQVDEIIRVRQLLIEAQNDTP